MFWKRNVAPARLGRMGERRAAWFYRLRGFRIVARNVRTRTGEIDLIVRRGSRLVFCEVKMRSRLDYGHPFEMVGADQEERLRHAASLWQAARPELAGLQSSFDIIGIHGRQIERLEHAF